jgi:hypothetical protein
MQWLRKMGRPKTERQASHARLETNAHLQRFGTVQARRTAAGNGHSVRCVIDQVDAGMVGLG